MSRAIAWIDGCWGTAETLGMPLNDRGLQLADGIFETVLLRHGRPLLLEQHLERWNSAAAMLGMAKPPRKENLMPLLQESVARAELGNGEAVLRLNWSRGASERGINLPAKGDERFWLTLQEGAALFSTVTAVISHGEQRNAASLLSRCKTFAYGQSIQARREARQRGAEEALLRNTKGELCCGTVANLLVKRKGRWLTPPLSSGCLPGVMRGRCLALKLATEADVGSDLQPGDQAVLINSLGCRPIRSLDEQQLEPMAEPMQLWEQLLD